MPNRVYTGMEKNHVANMFVNCNVFIKWQDGCKSNFSQLCDQVSNYQEHHHNAQEVQTHSFKYERNIKISRIDLKLYWSKDK